MCHESWARHRDEAVASRWLRDLARPTQSTSPVSEEAAEPVVEEPLKESDELATAGSSQGG
jgi:hypothetical protein